VRLGQDTGNHRIPGFETQTTSSNVANIVFGQGGFFTTGLANFGGNPTPETLDNPAGLAADPVGNLYVADQGNNRALGYNMNGVSRVGTFVKDFTQINNCIGSLAAGAICTITGRSGQSPTA
jgi:secreted PhoX family phosphatase